MKSKARTRAYPYRRVLAAASLAIVTALGLLMAPPPAYGNDLVQNISNTQVAALERALSKMRDHEHEIGALTGLMRDQFFEMPDAKICSKLVLPPINGVPDPSAKILELRRLMEEELAGLKQLVELSLEAVTMFPGIENKVLLPYQSDLRRLLDVNQDLRIESLLKEPKPLFRLAVDIDEAPPLSKELTLEFPRTGRKVTLNPNDHVTISFTNTTETGKGIVRESQPHWNNKFVILSLESTSENENGFFGVGISYIKSITIRHLDGTIEVVESGEPSDQELREAAKNPEGLQKLRERLRPRVYPKTIEHSSAN